MRALVFAGTTEGREISEFLALNGVQVTACVATEYGSMVMPCNGSIEVRAGRLKAKEIADMLEEYSLIIDATHPYAEIVSRNIKAVCEEAGREYIRVFRPSIKTDHAVNAGNFPQVVTVGNSADAAGFLNTVEGKVLVTTGSKELEIYTTVSDYENRLFVRVLPTLEVMEKCMELGFKGKNLICMQGPFSYEMNVAMLKQTGARYIVTKDTGAAGGFEEKISAAGDLGVTIVLISRPPEKAGLPIKELKEELSIRFNFTKNE
ncbi:MAG: precorrin-6x reductase [Eubacterium sp.]|jgi:precorrin-6x reductase|nr:precorrin-6x reductase [Eubacterium sp.]